MAALPGAPAGLITLKNDVSGAAVPGLASEISQSGMALYGGVPMQPGDLMEVQFQTPGNLRVAGIVRNRSGYCFGLKFLYPMSNGDVLTTVEQSGAAAAVALPLPVAGDDLIAQSAAWLAKHRGDVAIAISAALLFFALIGWDSHQPNLAQAQSPVESLTLGERILLRLGLAELQPVRKEIGNPKAQVWIDRHTALYYCSGAELYGKTEGGEMTTQRDAQLNSFEPAAGNYCQ